jgi:hypothetical protein
MVNSQSRQTTLFCMLARSLLGDSLPIVSDVGWLNLSLNRPRRNNHVCQWWRWGPHHPSAKKKQKQNPQYLGPRCPGHARSNLTSNSVRTGAAVTQTHQHMPVLDTNLQMREQVSRNIPFGSSSLTGKYNTGC